MAQANARKESGVMKTTGGRSHPTVAFISDSASDAIGEKTGVGRYVHALRTGIGKAGFDVVGSTPTLPSVLSPAHRILRLLRRYNYPLWSSYPDADIYHLTTQELGSLLILRRPKGPVVVTVHDIFRTCSVTTQSFSPSSRAIVCTCMWRWQVCGEPTA